MKRTLTLLAAALALGAGLITLPAHAARYDRDPAIRHAPPPPRHEHVPHPRRHHFWVEGHWRWNGHRHVWVQGHWERERPGYRYHAPRWEQGRDGRWHYREHRWER